MIMGGKTGLAVTAEERHRYWFFRGGAAAGAGVGCKSLWGSDGRDAGVRAGLEEIKRRLMEAFKADARGLQINTWRTD
jgi:hypothetical protein